ncbi:unnamed protein product, partial [Allacma fusca]
KNKTSIEKQQRPAQPNFLLTGSILPPCNKINRKCKSRAGCSCSSPSLSIGTEDTMPREVGTAPDPWSLLVI